MAHSEDTSRPRGPEAPGEPGSGRRPMDHGRPLQFGISIVPEAERLDEARAAVHAADEVGLDLVGIQDHPYQWRFLDTWALIATLLAETKRVRIFPDVANLPLRPPALM